MKDVETPFKRWYAKNKQKLSQRRKERYRRDSEYRKHIVEHQRLLRLRAPEPPHPPEYTMSFTEAAAHIGIDPSTLRNWMARKYFPEPKKFSGRYRLTDKQVSLLATIRTFFFIQGRRRAKFLPGFKALLINVHSHWE